MVPKTRMLRTYRRDDNVNDEVTTAIVIMPKVVMMEY
jgi:hypothetical protein